VFQHRKYVTDDRGILVGGLAGGEWKDICSEDLPWNPSKEFRQWFVKGNLDFVTRCNRYVQQEKDESKPNTSLDEFCIEKNLSVGSAYRMVIPNLQASFRSVSKYDKAQPQLNEESWAISGEWVLRHFIRHMGGSRVLTQQDCVKELDRTTSTGYPTSLDYHGKGDFLDRGPVNMLEDFWNMMGNEEERVMRPIWTCSQKYELRAAEKLLKNSIRTFTASPVEHSVALNRFCLDMNTKFYLSNGKTWSFVGASKFLQGWNALFARLSKHPNAFELDESEYDSSLFAKAMYGQMEIRWCMLSEEYKTPENLLRFQRLYDDIVHSVIVLENGELIQKHTGNPSGSANTIVDNTMILFRLFAYAWIELAKEKFGKSNAAAIAAAMTPDIVQRFYDGDLFGSYNDFMSNVEAALNGDDNTFTVSPECVGWFNPKSIALIWSSIGVTTNTPCEAPRALKDVSFLSQGFREDRGIWLPVPETARVLCSLRWGSSDDDVRWHLMRAYALRIDSWANLECRTFIQQYIEWIWNHPEYKEQLVGEINGISMSEIDGMYKSPDWCWALYAGLEEKGSPLVSEYFALLKILRNYFDSQLHNSLPSSSSFLLSSSILSC
jgi:hypothetical protein